MTNNFLLLKLVTNKVFSYDDDDLLSFYYDGILLMRS